MEKKKGKKYEIHKIRMEKSNHRMYICRLTICLQIFFAQIWKRKKEKKTESQT